MESLSLVVPPLLHVQGAGPLFEFRGEHVLRASILLGIAFVLALPVGWDRERAGRSAGLRTFPLVALASCAYVQLSQAAFPDDASARARVLQGLVTGIGFIGGGAILESDDRVRGTATAASVWKTGAIGAAVAYGRSDMALLLSLVTFATLRWLRAVESEKGLAE